MHSSQRSLSVIVIPAGERQPPGWFAMHPDNFVNDDERHAAHGRWHCLSSQGERVYRALEFRSDLPTNGLALDWQARNILGLDQSGAIAECMPVSLGLRPAWLSEYPRCLWNHPSPVVRLSFAITVLALIVAVLVAGLGFSAQRYGAATSIPIVDPAPRPPDTMTFLKNMAGEWRSADELLTIQGEKGVVEIIRQTHADPDVKHLDFYAAAPVHLDVALNQIELETPVGRWLMRLVPGVRRAKLVVTYPDKQQVVYE